MPRTYRGRSSRRSPRPSVPLKSRFKNSKFELNEKAKKFFKKFLKQTGVAIAVILLAYILKTAAPGLWANISPAIHSSLERDIDLIAVYNDTIGRIFPDIAIGTEEENEEIDTDYPPETYENYYYDDDVFIDGYEVFRNPEYDETFQPDIEDDDEIFSL